MSQKRRVGATSLVVASLFAVCWYVVHLHEVEQRSAFLARFERSFDSGIVQLIGRPQIEHIQRYWMPEFSRLAFRTPEVNEYVITAQLKRAGAVKWGRWLYTCNGSHYDGIYKHSYVEANRQSLLPSFPFPLQSYIPWAMQMIDGIPSTAGGTASIISVSSPINVTDPLVVKASAPAGTTCRIQVFPTDALLSPAAPKRPQAGGGVSWECNVNPKYAGSRISLLVHCAERRGNRTLENSTAAPNVEVLPATLR